MRTKPFYSVVNFLLFFGYLTFYGTLAAQTNMSGSITSDTHWTKIGSPYTLTGDVTVEEGVTLTVDAGVQVYLNHYSRDLKINGTLKAIGTPSDSIRFYGPSDYGGNLYFSDTSTDSELEYAKLDHLGRSISSYAAAVYLSKGADIKVSNCRFVSNYRNVRADPTTVSDFFNNDLITIHLLSASVDINSTWPLAGQEVIYRPEGDITVNSGITLSIAPSVNVYLEHHSRDLKIEGTLKAIGTPTDSIRFYGLSDYGGNLYFSGTSTDSELKYAKLDHLGRSISGYAAAVYLAKYADVNVSNCRFVSNYRNVRADPTTVSDFFNNDLITIHLLSASVDINSTWSLAGEEVIYQPEGDITVAAGDTLAIAPGVSVYLDHYSRDLKIDGTLKAIGKPANLIYFYGPSDYGGNIYFTTNSSNSVIKYARIERLGRSISALTAAIYDAGQFNNFSQCHINNNGVYGLRIVTSSPPTISYCNIYNNPTGVYVTEGNPVINNSNIYNNSAYGVNNTSTDIVDARNNWWGDASGPFHATNADGLGNKVSDNVLFDPFVGQEIPDSIVETTCPARDIFLISQQEVDDFVVDYGECDSLSGSLYISGGNNITDLTGLATLKYITGDLTLRNNTAITNLLGFENLISIGGHLKIEYNDQLATINQLALLASIGGEVTIAFNDVIGSLSGLGQLNTVGGKVTIRNNPLLSDCSSLCNLLNNSGINGAVNIYNNPSACSSLTEVSILCTSTLCPQGDISLTNQSEVNAFVTTFSACSIMPYSLSISGNAAITDLASLSFITEIMGHLTINNADGVMDLNGFQNLQNIGGNLVISNNDQLANLSGLQQLATIAGDLQISNNDALNTLSSLQQLGSIGGNLSIRYNDVLTDCGGLCDLLNNDGVTSTITISGNPSECSSLTEVTTLCSTSKCPAGDVTLKNQNEVNAFVATFTQCDSLPGHLHISGGTAITDLSGLAFVKYIAGDLTIINNYSIENLVGLDNLEAIGGNLYLSNNRNLKSIGQLGKLKTVTEEVSIYNNDSLKTLLGLGQLSAIGTDLKIQHNSHLTDCSIICDLLDSGNISGNIQISNNPSECSSVNEVQSLCAYGSQISTLFINNLPSSLEEGSTLNFEIAVDFPPTDSLFVNLSSSDLSKVPLATPIIILPGTNATNVSLLLPNDAIPETSEFITITAGATYLQPASAGFMLTDDSDIPIIELEILQDTVAEAAGYYATQGRIRRLVDDGTVLNVTLSPSIQNALFLPEGVSLPAGQLEKTFNIGIFDNTLVDGFRTIEITASMLIASCNCIATTNGVASHSLVIVDNDGPSLTLFANPLSLPEGVSNAGTLTIERNTPPTNDLLVTLMVSDDSELSLPSSVTIPQGETTITVPITTVADPIPDGNQQVSIQAISPNFSPGILSVIVTDINKPDLQIAAVSLPNPSAPALDQFQFRAFIWNNGLAASPTGVVLKGFLSEDEIIDASDFVIGEFSIDVPIPLGDTLEITDLGITPYQPKDYYLLFQVNPNQAITEVLYLNNTSEPVILSVLPDYFGSATVDEAIFEQGASIPIYGSSFKENGTIVPNAALEIYIINGLVRREIPVTTDDEGKYMLSFEPFPGEAGHFIVGANFPGEGSTTIQDEFDISGVSINSDDFVEFSLLLNDTINGSLTIKNLSNLPINNLSITPQSLPLGCDLTFETIATLQPYENTVIHYQISGEEVTDLTDFEKIPLVIKSGSDSLQGLTAYYLCQARKAHLKATISSINTTFSQSKSSYFEFKIINNGMGPTEDIIVDIPQVDWMKLVSLDTIPSVSSGDTTSIILEFIPTSNLPLNTPAKGNIVINAENGNFINLPFTLEKVSEESGNLTIDVIDQYTYFTEEAPHVADAHVVISHYFTGEVYAEGNTDAQGLFNATNLPEGQLRIVVQAASHKGYDGIVFIAPGRTNEEVIFLEYQAISFSWNVVPTTVEDEYEVSLIMEFETNVPVPVVVVEVPDTMPVLFGNETYSFFATLTNKGLITANEVDLILPEDSEYEFITNYVPKNLLAQQAIQVPIVMRRRGTSARTNGQTTNSLQRTAELLNITPSSFSSQMMNGNCVDIFAVLYWYECGENGLWERTGESFNWKGRACPGTIPVVRGEGHCHNCVPPAIASYSPASIDCKCNDCLKNLSSIVDAVLTLAGCIPGIGGTIAGGIGCIKNPSILGCGSAVGSGLGDAVESVSSIAAKLGKYASSIATSISGISCIVGLYGLAKDCGWICPSSPNQSGVATSRTPNSFPFILQEPMDNLYIGNEAYIAAIQLAVEFYGVTLYENENFIDFVSIVDQYVIEEREITEDERNYILEEMVYFDIPAEVINEFILRWNNTIQAWNSGIFSPDSTHDNIIDKTLLDAFIARIDSVVNHAETNGFETVETMIELSLISLQTLTKISSDPTEETAINPVCASVTINISQNLTMTREAFEGTLTVYNGHPTDALQNLSLNLEILDENGVWSNDLFEIETKEINTLTGIDGTGTLNSEMEGYAKIIFIPESGAAPQFPKNYSFGGSISYLDPFSGTIVTMPLIPATLQVNPSPDLFLHYFMQRDILGDDPLTTPIEPILPADLAVMVENNGYGIAQNVVIESAQPEIIENDKGLAVNFKLIGSNLQGEQANLGLNTINFGSIDPLSARIGQWYFTSDLLGHFVNYKTELVHLDSRGNPDLSLVSGAQLHELIRSISAYGAIEDGIDDFLVNEIKDDEDVPDAIYLSQGNLIYDVFPATSGNFTGNIKTVGHTTTLEVDPFALGWNYIKLDDPGEGNFTIESVTRSDGQIIPLKNVWLSQVTIPDTRAPIYENKFHFIDDFAVFSPVTYQVVWSPVNPDPPTIVDITGHPNEVTAEQVTTLRVIFNEVIEESSFTYEDLMLKFQGGANIIDPLVSITQIDSLTYDIDLSSLTVGNGFYTFVVQAAGIQNAIGTFGVTGKQVDWTQFLSVPVVKEFIGLPLGNKGISFDTLQLLFNLPIAIGTLTPDKFTITKEGIEQVGMLTIEPIGTDNKLFKLTGLGQFMSGDGDYALNIDLPNIQSLDNISGLAIQTIVLTLDTALPMLTNKVLISKGGLDNQHYTGVTLNFNEAIASINPSAISLSKNGILQNLSTLTIQEITKNWFEIKWLNQLSYPEGNYVFQLDMTKVKDLAGNTGNGVEALNWVVNRTTSLTISNVTITPDMGFSATDGITASKVIDLSFTINEAARNINIYQNDNGILTLLNSLSSATAGNIMLPIVFNTGGQTAIEITLEDLMGSTVRHLQSIYIDEAALAANWNLAANQQLTRHPDNLVLTFEDLLLVDQAIPKEAIKFTFDNTQLIVANWTFEKTGTKDYTLGNLGELPNQPGTYQVGLDLSYFQKRSSGITGNDFVYTSWEIVDTNRTPIADAGIDTLVTLATTLTLNGDNSYDKDGDELSYQWYAPANVQLNYDTIPNPSFTIAPTDQSASYVFLLSVSDGKVHNTDVIRVDIDLSVTNGNCLGTTITLDSDSLRSYLYAYENTISATAKVRQESVVTFKAGTSIHLLPGFLAEKGSVFIAKIEDCGDDKISPTNITIDGDFEDWANVPIISSNGSTGLNFLKAYDDCDAIYVYADGNLDVHFQLYIDSDFNTIGANEFTRHYPNTGINFMMEDAYPYVYTGTGEDWSWNQTSLDTEPFEISNNKLEMMIPKSIIPNLGADINLGFIILDSDWNISGKLPDADAGATYAGAVCDNFNDIEYALLNIEKINQQQDDVVFEVFPNPFRQTLNLTLDVKKAGNYSIAIYDILGKVAAQPLIENWLEKGKHQITVNLNATNSLYVVQLSNIDGSFTQKIVTQIKR